jgi:hypothetical protein
MVLVRRGVDPVGVARNLLAMDDEIAPLTPPAPDRSPADSEVGKKPREIGGPSGPEPTRYGDWERRGRCYDF